MSTPAEAAIAPTDSMSAFIVHAWRELLDPRSPDTYRARALNPFAMLDELVKVAEFAQGDAKWLSHVHSICAEISEESTAFFRLPLPAAAKGAFELLGKSTNARQEDLGRVRDVAMLVKDLCGDPLAILFDHVRKLVEADVREKSEFLRSLGHIATHAHRSGLAETSQAALSEFDASRPPQDALDTLQAALDPVRRNFRCFLAVSGDQSNIDSLLAGSELERAGTSRFDRSELALEWHAELPAHHVIEVAASDRSPRMAAEASLGRLQAMLNVLALYANAADYRIADVVLVQDATDFMLVDVSPEKHFGLFPRQGFIKTTRNRIRNVGERLDGRIANSLGAHALGISATDPRAALSHFWTSLEALVGPGSGNIGQRVATSIAPVVTFMRTHRIVLYLALQVKRTVESRGLRVDRDLMPASTAGHVAREDVLSCLTGVKDNAGIVHLLDVCSTNPLVIHHLYLAWQELSEPADLCKALRRSEKRVTWQLLRVYRARNLFVHKGEHDELVWRLLENAQSYISFALGRLLNDLAEHPTWSIDMAMEFNRQQFERVCGALQRGSKCTLTTLDLMPHITQRGHDVPLWGPASRFGTAP